MVTKEKIKEKIKLDRSYINYNKIMEKDYLTSLLI